VIVSAGLGLLMTWVLFERNFMVGALVELIRLLITWLFLFSAAKAFIRMNVQPVDKARHFVVGLICYLSLLTDFTLLFILRARHA